MAFWLYSSPFPLSLFLSLAHWLFCWILFQGLVSNTPLSGSDGVADANRQYQCFMFMRDPNNPGEPDSNHYAYPLPISPVMDAVTKKIVRVDKIPMGLETKRDKTQPYEIYPPNEYIPEAQESLRKDLKPLRVVQPEGVSFRITPLGETGQFVEWQKWAFQVGFNQREGMVLYNVSLGSNLQGAEGSLVC